MSAPLSSAERGTKTQLPSDVAAPTDLSSTTLPFVEYLKVVAFTATITVSVSLSASQGFATGGTFFGVALSGANDTTTVIAVQQTKDCAQLLSWSAALSSFSLMITLVLQLLMTDPSFVHKVFHNKWALRSFLGAGSWLAFGLQGATLAVIGQALKAINRASGTMIQWCLLAVGLPTLVLFIVLNVSNSRTRRGNV